MNTTTNTRVSEAMVDGPALLQIARDVGLREVMFNVSAERAIPLLQAFFSAALEAALSAEPAAQGEEWSRRMAVLEAGQYVGAGAHGIEDRPAPPAQPAERVPEGWNADLREAGQRIHAMALSNGWTTDSDAYAVSCLLEDMLTATPAPADGEEGVR